MTDNMILRGLVVVVAAGFIGLIVFVFSCADDIIEEIRKLRPDSDKKATP